MSPPAVAGDRTDRASQTRDTLDDGQATLTPVESEAHPRRASHEQEVDTGNTEAEPKYGWVIVACVFLINAHTWGLTQSYGVFLAFYLNSDRFSRPDPLTLAFMAGLAFATTLLVSPLVTLLVPRIGSKMTIVIGIAIQTGSLIAASFSTQMWHLVLSQGLAFGGGIGLIVNTTVSITPQWFVSKRSFAVAITTAGSGTGGLIYSLAIHAMIKSIGLEWTLRTLAIISFTVNIVTCLFIKDRNRDLRSVYNIFQVDFFRRQEFNLWVLWGFFSQLGFSILIFSLADFVQAMGFSSNQGSIAVAILNLSQAVGRPVIGLVSDRWGRLNVAGLSSLIACVSTLIIWISAGKYFAGIVVYALFGAFASSMWPTVAPVGVEVVGIRFLPSALSIYWLLLVPATVFAEPIALSMKNPGVNGYINVQVFTGCMFLAAFLSLWLLRCWKLRETRALPLNRTRSGSHRDRDAADSSKEHGSQKLGPLNLLIKDFCTIAKI